MKLVIEIPEGLKDALNHEEQWTALLCAEMRDVLNNGTPLTEWLNSFDTSSATKCFEAVNILKERLGHEET